MVNQCDFHYCWSSSVTNFKSVPAKFFSIQASIFAFSSGLKWFFQSPVWPASITFTQDFVTLISPFFYPLFSLKLPFRMKECPSLAKPALISIAMLTDSFLENLSTRTWSTNFSMFSSVNVLPKKSAIFRISFLISWYYMHNSIN